MSCRRNDGIHFDNQSNLKSCFSFFFRYDVFQKKEKTCPPCFYEIIETLVIVWEN